MDRDRILRSLFSHPTHISGSVTRRVTECDHAQWYGGLPQRASDTKVWRFDRLMERYRSSSVVRQMDRYIQHGETTTLEHCEHVAWVSFLWNERLRLGADEKLLVGSAILHDLYLYDWHDGKPERKRHGFTHPDTACRNAILHFGISEKEQAIIRSHMWPLTIRQIPKSREAVIICLADKYCALAETLARHRHFGTRSCSTD